MANLQVKGMSDDLYQALKDRAARDHRSVSQEVVSIISEYLAQPSRQAEQAAAEFLKLSGAWAENTSGKKIAQSIREERRSQRPHRELDDVFD